MHLITMAHYGEAQSFIDEFKLTKKSEHLFTADEVALVLTGEGPFEAAVKTAQAIELCKPSEVINAGICGALSPQLNVGEIYWIRTFYLISDLKPQFKTFQTGQDGIDCLTSFERIVGVNKAQHLTGVAPVVDREGWGVAMAAKNAQLPFSAVKMISDVAGSLGACELVKSNAYQYSTLLTHHLKEKLKTSTLSSSKHKPSSIFAVKLKEKGFHFTFTTAAQFEQLLNKIHLREEVSLEILFDSLNIHELAMNDLLPKERARRLILQLEERLDPLKKELNRLSSELQSSLKDHGIKITHDPLWENPQLQVQFEFSTQEELKEKSQVLASFNPKPYLKIFQGEIHVE